MNKTKYLKRILNGVLIWFVLQILVFMFVGLYFQVNEMTEIDEVILKITRILSICSLIYYIYLEKKEGNRLETEFSIYLMIPYINMTFVPMVILHYIYKIFIKINNVDLKKL